MRISSKHYAQALYGALSEASADKRSEVVRNFLHMIHMRGHIKWLNEIIGDIEDIMERESGVVTVNVSAAHDIDDTYITATVKQLITGENIVINRSVDDSLLGGLRIETKDKRWDVSVRGQLRALALTLTH